MNKIYTNNAPEAIGPYSQAVECGGLIYTSGQIAINPESGQIESNDIKGQTTQVMKNLTAVLEAAGSSVDKAIKTVCFLADMND
ncbi:MAG: Rid family hydrolase, partial [Monoglobus pectinilyticus]